MSISVAAALLSLTVGWKQHFVITLCSYASRNIPQLTLPTSHAALMLNKTGLALGNVYDCHEITDAKRRRIPLKMNQLFFAADPATLGRLEYRNV
jgi:hypothetical protein